MLRTWNLFLSSYENYVPAATRIDMNTVPRVPIDAASFHRGTDTIWSAVVFGTYMLGKRRGAPRRLPEPGLDVQDNKIFQQTKLTIPVLAIGGEKSFGAMEATVMRNVATNVGEAVVHGAGHWLMEENPTPTIALITDFLKG
jgi:pimeloyl-ACP methyl ester carboxylesterase